MHSLGSSYYEFFFKFYSSTTTSVYYVGYWRPRRCKSSNIKVIGTICKCNTISQEHYCSTSNTATSFTTNANTDTSTRTTTTITMLEAKVLEGQ